MAARQGTQGNAMMYSLITFVALFIIATVCAVIFYVKSEEYRTNNETNLAKLDEVANRSEQNRLAQIVGKPGEGESYLGTMGSLFDKLYAMMLGKPAPENTSAAVKFNEITMMAQSIVNNLGADVNPALGPDGIAILKTIEDLKQKLENARVELGDSGRITQNLQADLQAAQDQNEEEKKLFLEELDRFQTDYQKISDDFEALKQTMQAATDEQIQSFKDKLETEQAKLRQKQLDLEASESKLKETDQLLDTALGKLKEIKPTPNIEVQAFKPDARIVRIDLKNGVIYLDAGTADHIYRGLTFAIYDRNQPIPETGEGKAEVEVFQVNEKACAARIIKSDKKNPIVMEDIVSNLIWDSETSNRFVVVGQFDFDNDGRPDKDGDKRIIELIERWGGSVMEDVTVETDFIVIGLAPAALARPTQDEADIDPMAQQHYEQSVQRVNDYNALLKKANDLSVPVFNQKRFMYLIGYDTLAGQNP